MIEGHESKTSELESVLARWNGFPECILELIRSSDYGTAIELSFRYVWKNEKDVFRDDEEAPIVTLRLLLVQEFKIFNALNQAQLLRPENLNWGFAEVASVRKGKGSDSHERLGFSTLECLWEGERRIVAVFKDLEVIEPIDFEPVPLVSSP
jgi:hypothetical protein